MAAKCDAALHASGLDAAAAFSQFVDFADQANCPKRVLPRNSRLPRLFCSGARTNRIPPTTAMRPPLTVQPQGTRISPRKQSFAARRHRFPCSWREPLVIFRASWVRRDPRAMTNLNEKRAPAFYVR